MGHYRSEMYSESELEAERAAAREQTKRRADFIQKQIEEKGLVQFLAEMRISSFDGKISGW